MSFFGDRKTDEGREREQIVIAAMTNKEFTEPRLIIVSAVCGRSKWYEGGIEEWFEKRTKRKSKVNQ